MNLYYEIVWQVIHAYYTVRYKFSRSTNSKYWFPKVYDYVETCPGPGVVTRADIKNREVMVNGKVCDIHCVSPLA